VKLVHYASKVWGRAFQQIVASTCSMVLPYQVAFSTKTVLEPSRSGDVSSNLGRIYSSYLDKTQALQAALGRWV